MAEQFYLNRLQLKPRISNHASKFRCGRSFKVLVPLNEADSTMASSTSVDSSSAYLAESNVARILGVGLTFHMIAIVFVSLRTYTRLVLVKSFGKDDAMMILALVSTLKSQAPYPLALHARL